MIYLREATIEDRDLLFEWANDPETRRASFRMEKIGYEEHCRWFERILNDKNERQFILMNQDEPVGQVRLTLEGEDAVVSYSIAPDKRGLGYGKEIIRLAQDLTEGEKASTVSRRSLFLVKDIRVAMLIKTASEHCQVIVATQSARLLDSFAPEDILVVDRDKEKQVSRISRLEEEKLDKWLEDYSLSQLWEKNVIGGQP